MRTVIAIAVVLIFASLAFAKDEFHFYDTHGHYQGWATTDTANPRQKSVYDNHGRYQGRVMMDENGDARIYNQRGNYKGRATEQGWNVKK